MGKHSLKEWILATRPWSLSASATPIIITVAYLYWWGATINWYYALWALINILLFHIVGNLWNDYLDFKYKVDREDTLGSTVIYSGMFTAKEVRNYAIIMFVVAVAGGLTLVALTGLTLLWIGLIGAVFTILYTFLKYNALGDIVILLTFAILPSIGTSFITTGFIDWTVLWVAIPSGLITVAILHSNNIRDMKHDERAEISTFAMKLGYKTSVIVYSLEIFLPLAWIVICAIFQIVPPSSPIILVSLPFALKCYKKMTQSPKDGPSVLDGIDAMTAQYQLVFSGVLALVLVLDKLLF